MPVETTKEMQKRIKREYQLMDQVYKKQVGAVPDLYCIMHSNTSSYGDNANVSSANAASLEKMFKLNVNREGFSYNNRKSSPYDLTRLQPQAWWYTNHLLMRVKDDLPAKEQKQIKFVKGSQRRCKKWQLVKGAAEFKQNLIALTTESESNGLLILKKAKVGDCKLNCEFLGNKIGQQTVYLKTQGTASGKHNFASYLSLSLENNILYLRQKQGGAIKTLYKVDMFKLEDDKPVSVPKDKRAALSSELNVRGRFAQNSTTAALYKLKAFKKKRQKAKSVKEGAKEYVPEIQIQDPGDVKAELTVKGSSLTLTVNGQKLCQRQIKEQAAGGVALESAFGGFGQSQRNIADDVYDGAFKDLVIACPAGNWSHTTGSIFGTRSLTGSLIICNKLNPA